MWCGNNKFYSQENKNILYRETGGKLCVLVSQFGIDYMHMACLGVMRRLLLYWKGPVSPLTARLPRKSVLEISKHLAIFAAI